MLICVTAPRGATARLSELRALVEEHEYVDAVLRALDANGTASSAHV